MSFKRDDIIKYTIILMIVFSTMVVFQLFRRTFFLWFQILFCILMASTGKIKFIKSFFINFIFIELWITALSAYINYIPPSYLKAAVVMAIYTIPFYFTVAYIVSDRRNFCSFMKIIYHSLKIMCVIQLLWIPFQYVLYHFAHININDVIFIDTFHFVEKASFIRNWQYYPSGFSWHSAVLAPLFVLAFIILESKYFRALIIIDSLICGSSTSFVGVCICIMILYFDKIKNFKIKKVKVKTSSIMIGLMVLMLFLVLMIRMNFIEVLVERVSFLVNRVTNTESDSSTSAHLAYYSDYFKVIKRSSWIQILFGYGYGCSGYPISVMYKRYTSLGNWAVECDLVNIALSRGIIGFIFYYSFLFYIIIKGKKMDSRYSAFTFSVFVEGFGYNVQWDYVFFVELLLFFSIRYEVNIFKLFEQENKFGTTYNFKNLILGV